MALPATRFTRLERDERRAQILSCARRLFSEHHFGAVSTTDIAREAGVARGLVHHYFGTKRELYLEVVRSLARMPPQPVPEELEGRDLRDVLAEAVDRWLEVLGHNRVPWLAAIGAQGLGRDPEVEAVLEEAREEAADRVIAGLLAGDPRKASGELRALIRAFAGFAESASLEWLQRGRLTRDQLRVLLLDGLLTMFRSVLPLVEAGAPGPPAVPAATGT
ncbi:MAG TPA: helix-turn-helix domain-containing protein [Thermoleophilaceae bacterium]|nr:helix-turn-helix domain-containing protein [Thermoleophilaceae bacterium]